MMTSLRRRLDRGAFAQGIVLLILAALAAWLYTIQAAGLPQLLLESRPLLIAAGMLLLWLAASAAMVRQHRRRETGLGGIADDAFIVAHASQTGFAEQLAEQTASALRTAGCAAQLVPLSVLDPTVLRGRRALFIVSTTGEGDAPDTACRFVRQAMRSPAALADLRYGVLALGDRGYAQFCAFGHRLEHWLRLSGAQPLFDLVEVDNGDAAALRHWQHHLRPFIGHAEMADWQGPNYQRWTLVARDCVNPDGLGAPTFHLALQAPEPTPWQAGDIAEIGPRNAPAEVAALLADLGVAADAVARVDGESTTLGEVLGARLIPADPAARTALRGLDADSLLAKLPPLPHREYSIASLPADGRLELLVRQMRAGDGRLGHGSGWLTEHANLGDGIALRVRRNRNFHLDDRGQPLILIGNGTGIAGLRAHLKARIAAGHRRNWLLFGERSERSDFFFGDELRDWRREHFIEHLDLAFSRDQVQRVYVQQRLHEQQPRLRAWLADGAHVLVCGSLDGMAPGVDAVLREALGERGYDVFVDSGRYRRDVY